jgi:predicted regulator of Ras-like GTPase activity (Roadblock/LC7/MglB family)
MNWQEELIKQIKEIPGVEEIAIADTSGNYLEGSNNESAEEFAAVLSYIYQAGNGIGGVMALDTLNGVTIVTNKNKYLIAAFDEYIFGVKTTPTTILSKTKIKFTRLLEKATAQIDEF